MSDPLESLLTALQAQGARLDDPLKGAQVASLPAQHVLALIQEVQDRRAEGPKDTFRGRVRVAFGAAPRLGDDELLAAAALLRGALDADATTIAKVTADTAGYVVAARWRNVYTELLKAACDMLEVKHSVQPGKPGGLPANHQDLTAKVVEGSKLVVALTQQLMRAGYGTPDATFFMRIRALLECAERAKAVTVACKPELPTSL